jgi:hypothetical protein
VRGWGAVGNDRLEYFARTVTIAFVIASANGTCLRSASAEQGCPAGQLPSGIEERACKKLAPDSKLPLDPSQPMVFEAMQASMTIIYIQGIGRITPDTPAKLEQFLKTDDARMTKSITLHSPDGDLMAGLKLGEIIRKAGYSTSIGRSVLLDEAMDIYDYPQGECISACALAFLGGITRSYDAKATYRLPRLDADGPAAGGEGTQMSKLAVYIKQMGANPEILQTASNMAAKDAAYHVPVAPAKQMGIIFDQSGQTEFRIGDIKGSPVVRFDFSMQEKKYRGMIRCVDSAITLYILDRGGSFPKYLQTVKGATAEFVDGTSQTLQATASYAKAGDADMMTFKIPSLTAASFSGEGLWLSDIRNQDIDRRQSETHDAPDMQAEKM